MIQTPSFGIAQGEGHDNSYTYNDVDDGYHCAISIIEGGANTVPNGHGAFNNTISFNHVWNLLQGILNDGGALRIESGNKRFTALGNVIRNNKVHDVTDASASGDPNGYGGNGIYLDNQTGAVEVEQNLVYRVSDSAIYTPHGPALTGEPNTVSNNILAYSRQAMVNVNAPYPNGVPTTANANFVLTDNLFFFDRTLASSPRFAIQRGCTYTPSPPFPATFPFTGYQTWNDNLYWRTDSRFAVASQAFHVQSAPASGANAPCADDTDVAALTYYTFAAWQSTVGEDAQSVVQDPGFTDAGYPADDYSMPDGSPIPGFTVFDPGLAGRSNPLINPLPMAATFVTASYDPATDF